MVTKYRGLRIIKWIYRVLGGQVFLAGIAFGLILAFAPTMEINPETMQVSMTGQPAIAAIVFGGIVIVVGILLAILLEGFAELLTVFIDTEENTRLQTVLLKQLIRNQAHRPATTTAPPRKSDPKSLLDTEPEF